MFRLILHCYSLSLQGHKQEYHCLRGNKQAYHCTRKDVIASVACRKTRVPKSLIYLYDARPQNWYPQNWYGAHMQRKLRDQAAGTLDSSTHTCTQGLFSHISRKFEWIEGFFFRFVSVTNRGLEAVVRSRCSNCATIC